MYTHIIHRIVIFFGLVSAVICLIWNLAAGQELLYSAFISLCVLFASSIVLLIALQSIAKVLLKYLEEKRKEQILQQQAAAAEAKKQLESE